MSTIEWYLVRHAPTDAHGYYCGWLEKSILALPAEKLNDIHGLLPNNGAVFVSSSLRAQQTLAKITLSGWTPGSVETSDDLREQNFGAWEGKSYDDVDFPPINGLEQLADHTPPQGESFKALITRVAGVIKNIENRVQDGAVVLVCHAGTIRAALAVLLGYPAADVLRYMIEPLSVSRVTTFANQGVRVDFINRIR